MISEYTKLHIISSGDDSSEKQFYFRMDEKQHSRKQEKNIQRLFDNLNFVRVSGGHFTYFIFCLSVFFPL